MQEQTIFSGDDPAIIVSVTQNGQHAAANFDTTTTRVDGNSAIPQITSISTGNYKISFPNLTPAPAEGDELLVRVNGSITGNAWTEAVYKLKVLPQILTAMDGKLDTIESTAEDTLFAAENDIPQSISNLNDLSSAAVQTACNAALVGLHLDHLLAEDYDPASKPGVATALLNELIESDAGSSRFTANALENAATGDLTTQIENALVAVGAARQSDLPDGFETLVIVGGSARATIDGGFPIPLESDAPIESQAYAIRDADFEANFAVATTTGTKLVFTLRETSRSDEAELEIDSDVGLEIGPHSTVTAADAVVERIDAGTVRVFIKASTFNGLGRKNYVFDLREINAAATPPTTNVKASGVLSIQRTAGREIAT